METNLLDTSDSDADSVSTPHAPSSLPSALIDFDFGIGPSDGGSAAAGPASQAPAVDSLSLDPNTKLSPQVLTHQSAAACTSTASMIEIISCCQTLNGVWYQMRRH